MALLLRGCEGIACAISTVMTFLGGSEAITCDNLYSNLSCFEYSNAITCDNLYSKLPCLESSDVITCDNLYSNFPFLESCEVTTCDKLCSKLPCLKCCEVITCDNFHCNATRFSNVLLFFTFTIKVQGKGYRVLIPTLSYFSQSEKGICHRFLVHHLNTHRYIKF